MAPFAALAMPFAAMALNRGDKEAMAFADP